MNAAVYVFGELADGYTQYPEDYTSEIFHRFLMNAQVVTQIAIHRDGNLMYYGYVRKLEHGRSIGFCVVLNDCMLTCIDGMFAFFEYTVAYMTENGWLIHFNEKGEIGTNVERMYLNREETELITEILRSGFKQYEKYIMALPPVDYSLSKDSVKTFTVDDDRREILGVIHSYGYTYIYKTEGCNALYLNSYRSVLSRLNKEKEDLEKRYGDLVREHKQTLRRKKQIKTIVVLVSVIVVAVMAFGVLNGNLHDKERDLANAKKSIEYKDKQIERLKMDSLALTEALDTEREKSEKAATSLSALKSCLSDKMPIVVSKIEMANTDKRGDIETNYGGILYSNKTMFLKPKVHYVGINNGACITMYVKLYAPYGLTTGTNSPSGYSYSDAINVHDGKNTVELNGWGGETQGNWSSGVYRIELWYKGTCLKSETFTIYDEGQTPL